MQILEFSQINDSIKQDEGRFILKFYSKPNVVFWSIQIAKFRTNK